MAIHISCAFQFLSKQTAGSRRLLESIFNKAILEGPYPGRWMAMLSSGKRKREKEKKKRLSKWTPPIDVLGGWNRWEPCIFE